jgi:uncharacterized RDD family membrane protein YckC
MTNTPSLARRLACNLYEALLLLALLFIALFPFAAITHALPPTLGATLHWIFLFTLSGFYFTLFWRKGQTLAMKTWRIRIETHDGMPPSRSQAWLRYTLASLNLLLLGIGWWSAFFKKDGQFLQDQIAKTRLVSVVPPTTTRQTPPKRTAKQAVMRA